jgi:hypothetical protein
LPQQSQEHQAEKTPFHRDLEGAFQHFQNHRPTLGADENHQDYRGHRDLQQVVENPYCLARQNFQQTDLLALQHPQ